MPILVKCPQCQKPSTLSDDKRGKQIRCQDCFQVFQAGKPPAGAAVMEAPSPSFIDAFQQTFEYLGMRYGGCVHANCVDGYIAAKYEEDVKRFVKLLTG